MKCNPSCALVLFLLLPVATNFGCKPEGVSVNPTRAATNATPTASPSAASNSTKTSDLSAATPALKTDGAWKVISATIAGQALPPEAAQAIALTLTNDQYLVNVGGAIDKGTFTTDLSTTPNRMTIKGTEGPNAGKTMLTIFDAPDAQTMRLCYDLEGKKFPQLFESTVENKYFFVTYVRQ